MVLKVFTCLLMAASLAVAVPGCGGHANGPAASDAIATPPVQVKTAVVQNALLGAPYEAVGTVRPKTSATVQSKIMGQVRAIHVSPGQTVEAGQLLVEIDDREAMAQLQRAQSALQETEHAANEAGQLLRASDATKAEAEAARQLAAATFARYANLSGQGAVSRQAYDEAQAKDKAAVANVKRAEETLLSMQSKQAEAQARVNRAKAEVENAQVSLSYTKVLAPFAGLITQKDVDPGDMASPGSPLFTLEDTRTYRLEAQVDEAHIALAKMGEKTGVVVDGLPSAGIAGTISEIVPAADPASRTFLVKVDLPEQPGLRSGMFGRLRLDVAARQTLTVPQNAVVVRGQLTIVYVIDAEKRARMRLVTLGKTVDDRVEVLSGLNAGETIVADNVAQVTDGSRIAG